MTRTRRINLILTHDSLRLPGRAESYLRRRGVEVKVAPSGAEILHRARRDRPDAVLLPHSLPDLKGDEVCRRLRTAAGPRRLRVIVVGPKRPKAVAARYLRAGCDAYLGASTRPDGLLRRLAQQLGLIIRRHPRVATSIAVSSGDLISEFLGYARDISRGGMLLESARKLDPGRTLQLRLFLDHRESPLVTRATVVRTSPAADADQRLLALRFSAMSRPSSARLRNYITTRLPR